MPTRITATKRAINPLRCFVMIYATNGDNITLLCIQVCAERIIRFHHHVGYTRRGFGNINVISLYPSR